MLKKILATSVAALLTVGLAFATAAPASAATDGRPGGGWGSKSTSSSSKPSPSPAPATSPSPSPSPATSSAPAPAPAPKSTPTQAPAAQQSAAQAPAAQAPAASTSTAKGSSSSTTRYGIAVYVYKKVDASKPASWGNSGPQRLVLSDVDNTSKDANPWYTSLDAALLPGDVCGSGWAVQQDKVSFTGTFTYPATITPPTDNIGWPPIYDAKHSELSSLVTVPLCAGAAAAVTITPASCQAPASIALGAVTHASWGTLDRAVGPGAYSVTATADTGYRFDDGATTKVFSGVLDGTLGADSPACAPPPSCIPSSAVSYTYDAATNSGVITVAAPARSTGELCAPFWVTATSWRYLGTSTWIQKIDQVQKLGEISKPGSYPYSAKVTCGQGDIYASYRADDETLSPTTYLYGPDDPFDENFLHQMGFSGPNPTYMTTKTGCNTVTAEPTSTPPSCTAEGQFSLPLVEHVRWYRDGVELPAGSYSVTAGGTAVITAIADDSWVLKGGTQDTATHEWSLRWTLDFPEADCQPPTLTGSITAICVNDVPMLHYRVTLTDPDGMSQGDTATLTLTDGTEAYTYDPALGTLHDGETLVGNRLWPGATVDSAGNPTGWPGWAFDGITWVETDGNYAWSRADGLTARISTNPELEVTVDYPGGDPSCSPGPREISLGLDWTNLSCDADTGGSYTLDPTAGVSWLVDGEPTEPGTYTVSEPGTVHVEAVPDQSGGAVRFPDEATAEWDLVFTAPEECLTVGGSTVTGKCEADSPWIYYTVTLTDPYKQTSSYQPRLVMTDGTNTEIIDLQQLPQPTLGSDGRYEPVTVSSRVLWPGASVDPVTGAADGWPGWVRASDGTWQPTTGNFAWTRAITQATLEVNPSMSVDLSYPPASPNCITEPPHDPPTLGLFPTSAVLAEQCTTHGRGVLTLGQVDGVSFFDDVNYFIDGVPASSSTVALSPGTYEVTVTTKNASDGLDGATAWRVVVTGGQVCGELATLALTGFDAGYLVALAALLVAVGATLAVTGRVRPRRAE